MEEYRDLTTGQATFQTLVTIAPFPLFILLLASLSGVKIGNAELQFYPILAVWGFVSLITCSIRLYWIRERNRLTYGLLECLAATFILTVSMVKLAHIPSHADLWETIYPILAQLFGSMYVVVRGIDNVVVGLKDYERGEALANWLAMRPLAKEEQKTPPAP